MQEGKKAGNHVGFKLSSWVKHSWEIKCLVFGLAKEYWFKIPLLAELFSCLMSAIYSLMLVVGTVLEGRIKKTETNSYHLYSDMSPRRSDIWERSTSCWRASQVQGGRWPGCWTPSRRRRRSRHSACQHSSKRLRRGTSDREADLRN